MYDDALYSKVFVLYLEISMGEVMHVWVKVCAHRAEPYEHQHTGLSPGAYAKKWFRMAVQVWCAQHCIYLSMTLIVQLMKLRTQV